MKKFDYTEDMNVLIYSIFTRPQISKFCKKFPGADLKDMNVLTPGFLLKSYKDSIDLEENFPSFSKIVSYVRTPTPSIYRSLTTMQPSEIKSPIDPNEFVFADSDDQTVPDSPTLAHVNHRKGEAYKNSMCRSPLGKNAKGSPCLVRHHHGSIQNCLGHRPTAMKRSSRGPKTMIHLAADTHFNISQLNNDNPGSSKNIPFKVKVKGPAQSLFMKKLEDAGILKSPRGELEDADIPQFTNDLKKKFEIGKQAKDIGTFVKVLRQFIETDLQGLSKERKKFYKLKLTEDLRTVNMQSEQEIMVSESNLSPTKIHRRDGKSMRVITAGKGMSHKLVLEKKSKNFLPFTPLELKTFHYNTSPHGALGE